MRTRVTVSVTVDNADQALRVAETYARANIGLALEGLETFIATEPPEDEPAEVDE